LVVLQTSISCAQADYQNTKEFLGVIVGLMVISKVFKVPRGTRILWKGDNKAALSWVNDNKARSASAQASFITYSWILVRSGLVLVPARHEHGAIAEMKDLDDLSRERTVAGLDPDLNVELAAYDGVDELFALCSPLRDSTVLKDHAILLENISILVNRFF